MKETMFGCADCGKTLTFYRLCDDCWQAWRERIFRRYVDAVIERMEGEW